MQRTSLLSITTLTLTALIAVPAVAQQRSDQQRNDDTQSSRQERSDESSQGYDTQGEQDQERDQREDQASGERLRLSPEGWVRIAADYDNDGRFDAVETIFLWDLEQAQQASRNRQQRERTERARPSFDDHRTGRTASREQMNLSGEIKELKTVNLLGTSQSQRKQQVARITTSDGRTAKVLLGPQSQLSELELQQGDRVTVQGVRGRVNDKTMLIARRISSDAGQVRIESQRPTLRRVQGEIESLRKANFRGFDEAHVCAKVRLQNGQQTPVNLGPSSRVGRLDLQQGDQLTMLVRQGQINGESALIAEQIEHDGQRVSLPRPEDTQRFRGERDDGDQ